MFERNHVLISEKIDCRLFLLINQISIEGSSAIAHHQSSLLLFLFVISYGVQSFHHFKNCPCLRLTISQLQAFDKFLPVLLNTVMDDKGP